MCTRAVHSKSHLLKAFLQLAAEFVEKQLLGFFVFCGDGELYHELSDISRKINHASTRQCIKLIKGINSITYIVHLYNYSDIIIGNGRGIMEAMSCGKPVLCIGKNGYGSTVRPDNVDITAYYNFSGRHLEYHPNLRSNLMDATITLAKDKVARNKLGNWGRQYILSYYSSGLILDKLLSIYNEP